MLSHYVIVPTLASCMELRAHLETLMPKHWTGLVDFELHVTRPQSLNQKCDGARASHRSLVFFSQPHDKPRRNGRAPYSRDLTRSLSIMITIKLDR